MTWDGALEVDGTLDLGVSLEYFYDVENRLTAVENRDSRVEFTYDYMGRRVRQVTFARTGAGTVDHVLTTTQDLRFIYDGWHMIAQIKAVTTTSGTTFTPQKVYVWGLDISGTRGGAGGIGGLLAWYDRTVGQMYAPCYDGRGNVQAIYGMNDSHVISEYEYDQYGKNIRTTGYVKDATTAVWGMVAYDPISNPFRYQTKWRLQDSTGINNSTGYSQFDLYDYGKRWYNPKHGRFINRDPIGEQGGLNLYAFVGNDPVNNNDMLVEANTEDIEFYNKWAADNPWGFRPSYYLDDQGNRVYYLDPINSNGVEDGPSTITFDPDDFLRNNPLVNNIFQPPTLTFTPPTGGGTPGGGNGDKGGKGDKGDKSNDKDKNKNKPWDKDTCDKLSARISNYQSTINNQSSSLSELLGNNPGASQYITSPFAYSLSTAGNVYQAADTAVNSIEVAGLISSYGRNVVQNSVVARDLLRVMPGVGVGASIVQTGYGVYGMVNHTKGAGYDVAAGLSNYGLTTTLIASYGAAEGTTMGAVSRIGGPIAAAGGLATLASLYAYSRYASLSNDRNVAQTANYLSEYINKNQNTLNSYVNDYNTHCK